METDRFILTPFVKVGEFLLNESISKYLNKYKFTVSKELYDGYFVMNYSLENPDMTIFLKHNNCQIIDFIACYEVLFYKSVNLIGLTIDEFKNVTKSEYYGEVDELDFEEDNIPQYVYEFDDLGLQVWEKGKNGKIVTIIISGIEDYQDD